MPPKEQGGPRGWSRARGGSVTGPKVREAVAVRSRGQVVLRTLGSTLSELESHQRVSRDMICLEGPYGSYVEKKLLYANGYLVRTTDTEYKSLDQGSGNLHPSH